jgi:F-type H+-transporting ATPase subunit epsilon
MKTFHLIITRIDGPVFDGQATSVTLPGEAGEMTVLANHEALITRLKEGTITVHAEGRTNTHTIQSGVVEIAQNKVTVLL